MLPPHELKNKTFTRAMRGYNPVEVDEYIEFITQKYTELYRENDELDRKLKSTIAKLEEIRSEEDSIRAALVDAKQAAARIKADAERQAEAIIRSAKSSCNSILTNFNTKIEEGQQVLVAIKSDAALLKSELFERYTAHIESIRGLTDGIDMSDVPDTDELRREAVESLKAGIAAAYAKAVEDATAEPEAEPEVESEPELEPEAEEEEITFAPAEEEISPDPADENLTQFFDTVGTSENIPIERTQLAAPKSKNPKDSILEINKLYKEEEAVSTPDSDLEGDENYLDFVNSVTGKKKDPKKEEQFDMLFSDSKSGKKKK